MHARLLVPRRVVVAVDRLKVGAGGLVVAEEPIIHFVVPPIPVFNTLASCEEVVRQPLVAVGVDAQITASRVLQTQPGQLSVPWLEWLQLCGGKGPPRAEN